MSKTLRLLATFALCHTAILNCQSDEHKDNATKQQGQSRQTINSTKLKQAIDTCLRAIINKLQVMKMVLDWSRRAEVQEKVVERVRDIQKSICQELYRRRYEAYEAKKLYTKSKRLKAAVEQQSKYFTALAQRIKQDDRGELEALERDLLMACGYNILGSCDTCYDHLVYDTATQRLDEFAKKYQAEGKTQEHGKIFDAIKANYAKMHALARELDQFIGCSVDSDNNHTCSYDPQCLRHIYDHLDLLVRSIKYVAIDDPDDVFRYPSSKLDKNIGGKECDDKYVGRWADVLVTTKHMRAWLKDESCGHEIRIEELDKLIDGLEAASKNFDEEFVAKIIRDLDKILTEQDRKYVGEYCTTNAEEGELYIVTHRILVRMFDKVSGEVMARESSRDITAFMSYYDHIREDMESYCGTLSDGNYGSLHHRPCLNQWYSMRYGNREKYFITSTDGYDMFPSLCEHEKPSVAHIWPHSYLAYYFYGSEHEKYRDVAEEAVKHEEEAARVIDGYV